MLPVTLKIAIVAILAVTTTELRLLAQQRGGGNAESAVFVGDFHNLENRAGMQFGYMVTVWRSGDRLLGLWSKASGQDADFPTVFFEDVPINTQTGQFSLTITWCSELMRFDGVLTSTDMSGIMARQDHSSETLRLPKAGGTRAQRPRSKLVELYRQIAVRLRRLAER